VLQRKGALLGRSLRATDEGEGTVGC
jgi:hypothetical protein